MRWGVNKAKSVIYLRVIGRERDDVGGSNCKIHVGLGNIASTTLHYKCCRTIFVESSGDCAKVFLASGELSSRLVGSKQKKKRDESFTLTFF